MSFGDKIHIINFGSKISYKNSAKKRNKYLFNHRRLPNIASKLTVNHHKIRIIIKSMFIADVNRWDVHRGG